MGAVGAPLGTFLPGKVEAVVTRLLLVTDPSRLPTLVQDGQVAGEMLSPMGSGQGLRPHGPSWSLGKSRPVWSPSQGLLNPYSVLPLGGPDS